MRGSFPTPGRLSEPCQWGSSAVVPGSPAWPGHAQAGKNLKLNSNIRLCVRAASQLTSKLSLALMALPVRFGRVLSLTRRDLPLAVTCPKCHARGQGRTYYRGRLPWLLTSVPGSEGAPARRSGPLSPAYSGPIARAVEAQWQVRSAQVYYSAKKQGQRRAHHDGES
jgi:hypothetical protein